MLCSRTAVNIGILLLVGCHAPEPRGSAPPGSPISERWTSPAAQDGRVDPEAAARTWPHVSSRALGPAALETRLPAPARRPTWSPATVAAAGSAGSLSAAGSAASLSAAGSAETLSAPGSAESLSGAGSAGSFSGERSAGSPSAAGSKVAGGGSGQGRAGQVPPMVPAPVGWEGEASPARALLGSLEGAVLDPTRGAALAAAIEALPPERRALGLQGLTPTDLWGPEDDGTGLCERPALTAPVDGGEISLVVDGLVWMTPPARDRIGWPQACADALLASGGDLAAADACLPEDEATFYPEGSACRTCLEVDGDVARCVAEQSCPATATRKLYGPDGRGGSDWVSALATSFLTCAPDLELPSLLLVPDLAEDDPLPRVFEPGRYVSMCVELWDDRGSESTTLYCNTAAAGGHALADLVAARVLDGPHQDRVAMASSVGAADGRRWEMQFVYESTLGAVSVPLEAGGWGLDPWKGRPDGGSFARELLAGWTLKLTTTRSGVPVQPIDHDRCLDWTAPDATGASTCREMGPWTFTWLDDGPVVWFDAAAGDIYVFPLLTLVSTGLPDPAIPGGVVMDTRGSTTLAELEGCAWPDAFTPDRIRLYDSAPATSPDPYASFDGQTFRFDRDPEVVLALATNQRRGFCPVGYQRR